MMIRGFAKFVVSVLTLCLIAGCEKKPEKRVITVSYPMQEYLLREIVGDDYEINTLVRPGTNPETYDPQISSIRGLQNSQIFLQAGTAGFEENLVSKLRKETPSLKIADIGKGIERIKGSHSDRNGHDLGDPHIFNSVKNLEIIAQNIFEEVALLNPAEKDRYEANYSYLLERLQDINSQIESLLSGSQGKAFLVIHPVLSYFARDYGMEQISIERDGKEPSPKQFQQRIEEARAKNVCVMLHDATMSSREAEIVSSELGIENIVFNLSGEDWMEQFLVIANALTR